MIDIKELRIGNYIECIYEVEIDRGEGIIEDVETSCVGQVLCVSDIPDFTEYKIWVDGESGREMYDSFEPITLTEEWLLKFGFNHLDSHEFCDPNESVSLIKGSEVYYEPNLGLYIKYVHQLQNLCFALTGEELEMNKL